MEIGDSVVIAGSTAVGGVPAEEINKTHTVGNIIDTNTFEVPVTTAPTSDVDNGGGDSVTIDGDPPKPPPISTTASSATVTVYQTAHGLAVGDKVLITGAMEVGGIPQYVLNSEHTVVSVPSTDSFTFTASTTATSTATGGGRLVIVKLPVKATSVTTGGGSNTKIRIPVVAQTITASGTLL